MKLLCFRTLQIIVVCSLTALCAAQSMTAQVDPTSEARKPLDRAAEALQSCMKKDYPAAAARARAAGTTRVRVEVDADGVVQRAAIAKSAGETAEHKLLDRLALEVVFCPGLFRLANEPYTREVDYVWKLD